MLELDAVCAGYGRLPVLFDVNLRVATGEIVAVIGPNGAGKSTLLKTAIGALRPTSGTVIIDKSRVTHEPPHLRVRRGLALSPEGRRVFANLTVAENLVSGEGGVSKQIALQQRERMFALFPILRERLDQTAGSMSGGEQQMLAIGRAMMSAPKVIMIDELSLGLAPLVVAELYISLRSLADEGHGVLVVDERANQMMVAADRTYVMEKGRILFEGSHGDAQLHLAASTMLGPQFSRD